MKMGDSENSSILSCYVSKHNKNLDTWRLEIIFDSALQETEGFAKVMVELMTFLLWE
jgi:hypothetical protein